MEQYFGTFNSQQLWMPLFLCPSLYGATSFSDASE